MDYLKAVLGIDVAIRPLENKSFPLFIRERYRIEKARFGNLDALLVTPLGELEAIGSVEKQLERIKSAENLPIVLAFDHLTLRQRNMLLERRIPFVVDNRQIYLPFLGVCLQERGDSETIDSPTFQPASQLVLLHFIYRGSGRANMSDISRALDLSPMSTSRAVRQLEEYGLVSARKEGVNKIICSSLTPKELFEKAERYLFNPRKRTVCIPLEMSSGALRSGYSALADYTMLAEPKVAVYADSSISRYGNAVSNRLLDESKEVFLEFWRYDPKKLSKAGKVDPLSLALSLRDDNDERVEGAVEELLEAVWRNNGFWNQ